MPVLVLLSMVGVGMQRSETIYLVFNTQQTPTKCLYAIMAEHCRELFYSFSECMDANMQLTINSFRQHFPDKIFSLTIPLFLVKSLTFPWQLSNSLTFPGFPDKWSPCKEKDVSRKIWFHGNRVQLTTIESTSMFQQLDDTVQLTAKWSSCSLIRAILVTEHFTSIFDTHSLLIIYYCNLSAVFCLVTTSPPRGSVLFTACQWQWPVCRKALCSVLP